jgi:hypothetical protein
MAPFAAGDALLLDGRSLLAWPLCPAGTGPPLLWVEAEATGEERFAAHFVRAWSRIPEPVRAELLAHWRSRPPWPGTPGTPFLRLLVALDPAGLDPHGRATFAVFWTHTRGIDFAAPLVAGRRAGAVEALVAHELAHAYAHARRLSPNGEELANGLMRQWGFDPEQLPAGP